MRVNIKELVVAFDEEDDVQRHSNSLKVFFSEELGLALLNHYFHEIDNGPFKSKLVMDRQGRRLPCTTGGRSGYQLDGWVLRDLPNGQQCVYQVEIKCWSYHGIGSKDRKFPLKMDNDVLGFKRKLWRNYVGDDLRITQDKVAKVLLELEKGKLNKLVSGYSEVRPLLCIWEAAHPEGLNEEFFACKVCESQASGVMMKNKNELKYGGFSEFYVFSMSQYLRNLISNNIETIELDMPDCDSRMSLINRIFV